MLEVGFFRKYSPLSNCLRMLVQCESADTVNRLRSIEQNVETALAVGRQLRSHTKKTKEVGVASKLLLRCGE